MRQAVAGGRNSGIVYIHTGSATVACGVFVNSPDVVQARIPSIKRFAGAAAFSYKKVITVRVAPLGPGKRLRLQLFSVQGRLLTSTTVVTGSKETILSLRPAHSGTFIVRLLCDEQPGDVWNVSVLY
jgi:hypothetical protein